MTGVDHASEVIVLTALRDELRARLGPKFDVAVVTTRSYTPTVEVKDRRGGTIHAEFFILNTVLIGTSFNGPFDVPLADETLFDKVHAFITRTQ